MTARWIRRLETYLGADRRHLDPELDEQVKQANVAASGAALHRLSSIYDTAGLDTPRRRFKEASSHQKAFSRSRACTISDIVGDVCAAPRAVAQEARPTGLEVAVKLPGRALRLEDLGSRVEMDSNSIMFDPDRLLTCIAAGGSVELRQFDRHCPAWAWIADDLAIATGADIYLKLFLAGGQQSANGWHQDATDVIATTLVGNKRFQVKAPTAADSPDLDCAIQPGDVVRVPRGWEHCVTPTGAVSALLSCGIMRPTDWIFRNTPPSHLGFTDYPRSTLLYRLAIKPHVAPTMWPSTLEKAKLVRSRIIGGIHVVDDTGGGVAVSINGDSYAIHPQALTILLAIQSDGIMEVERLVATSTSDAATTLVVLRALCESGLVRVDAN